MWTQHTPISRERRNFKWPRRKRKSESPPLGECSCRSECFCSRFCKTLFPVYSEGPIFRQVDNDEPGGRRRPIPVRLQICRRAKAAPACRVDHAGWIFTKSYFMKHPGVYIQQQIQWKTLEIYSCFRSGHCVGCGFPGRPIKSCEQIVTASE